MIIIIIICCNCITYCNAKILFSNKINFKMITSHVNDISRLYGGGIIGTNPITRSKGKPLFSNNKTVKKSLPKKPNRDWKLLLRTFLYSFIDPSYGPETRAGSISSSIDGRVVGR